jgi:hypothetical protein
MDYGSPWGTDQIHAFTPMNHNYSDLFYTAPKIKKEMQWPKPSYKYSVAKPEVLKAPKAPTKESFVDEYGNYPIITENMLVILLLVLLVIMCTVIYSTVKQTCETMKLLAAIIAAK